MSLLRAVSSYDLIAVGLRLADYVRLVGADALGFEVLAWILARQSNDGHFGALQPELLALRKSGLSATDCFRRVQLPICAAILAGIAKFVSVA
jgi:hypothetical protein